MYDLIGDIHGHADELEQLLKQLGYQQQHGIYSHSERKVIFVGDFIDRGPQIRQVLEIARWMVEEGKALAVMGNHELNALAYHAVDDPQAPNRYLRPHTPKNDHQHHKTLEQLHWWTSSPDRNSYLDWFRKFPLWLDLDGLRAVHACWDDQAMRTIDQALCEHGGFTDSFLQSACTKEAALFDSIEVVLKGKEAKLPDGKWYLDKDGHKRFDIRTRWYLAPDGHTYRSYALLANEVDCDLPMTGEAIEEAAPYPDDAKPVFFGHYWLRADRPTVLAENVACLDFSVADSGFLCAYRWSGEQKLSNDNFVWVEEKRP